MPSLWPWSRCGICRTPPSARGCPTAQLLPNPHRADNWRELWERCDGVRAIARSHEVLRAVAATEHTLTPDRWTRRRWEGWLRSPTWPMMMVRRVRCPRRQRLQLPHSSSAALNLLSWLCSCEATPTLNHRSRTGRRIPVMPGIERRGVEMCGASVPGGRKMWWTRLNPYPFCAISYGAWPEAPPRQRSAAMGSRGWWPSPPGASPSYSPNFPPRVNWHAKLSYKLRFGKSPSANTQIKPVGR